MALTPIAPKNVLEEHFSEGVKSRVAGDLTARLRLGRPDIYPRATGVMALYCAAKMAAFAAAVTAGAGWRTAILHTWTEADQALWVGVLHRWFLGRV